MFRPAPYVWKVEAGSNPEQFLTCRWPQAHGDLWPVVGIGRVTQT